MSTVTNDNVRHLASLSNIQLTDDEAQHLQADIENILTHIQQLSQLDTTGVEPTYQVTGLSNVWRDDTVVESTATTADLLALAPEQDSNHIKVPKVL